MDKMIRRSVIGFVLILAVLAVIYWFPQWLFCAVVALLVGLAQFEFFRMVENRKIFVYKYFGTIVGSLVPVVIFLGNGFQDIKHLEPILIMAASIFVFTLQFVRKDNAKDHLVSMSVTLFSLFYISWFFSFFVKLRLLDNGANLVAFLVIVTKGADVGAYLGGSRFGRNELMSRISPNKTKEGTLTGILLSVLLALTVGRVLTGFSFLHALIIGIVLAAIGQVGDLAESLIKRDCGVKDSGSYLYTIGGVFDLIDSLLFTAPVFYFYMKTF
ncbi:MAG: phosphatidate cytidylyltransferase [Candidatus Omnitrophica bacterium]|nr:phosphatidate cytidylyltransferase [Candidatus Omnitrophota bacterium]MBU1127676.1 phosphatidate cytidylyltransferase [Candidatus Omnitrophota bacterium]MBU1784703.1 phosphatidate cytidylyltransferase [Candidatus Omnitrophota bacterium]MBU1851465.1 phosphatidate cytidylyltransferase [Candidatus Omnitrophota bacterium]